MTTVKGGSKGFYDAGNHNVAGYWSTARKKKANGMDGAFCKDVPLLLCVIDKMLSLGGCLGTLLVQLHTSHNSV